MRVSTGRQGERRSLAAADKQGGAGRSRSRPGLSRPDPHQARSSYCRALEAWAAVRAGGPPPVWSKGKEPSSMTSSRMPLAHTSTLRPSYPICSGAQGAGQGGHVSRGPGRQAGLWTKGSGPGGRGAATTRAGSAQRGEQQVPGRKSCGRGDAREPRRLRRSRLPVRGHPPCRSCC